MANQETFSDITEDFEDQEQFRKELDRRIDLGNYKQIAQKLDKHLQDIYEADQTQKNRWVWQLIQNAKDIPNEFNKTRIKIIITQNEMQFMHNANPFTLDNLIALVQQFSSKSDKNSQEVQTTGKYGTGFITTHMISRKILVNGIFQYCLKDKIERVRNFQILLDRDYKDRDTDLVDKVSANMYQLKTIGGTYGKKKPKRNEYQFDTIFSYQNLDSTALKYIEAGIEDLLRSCHYTFLFNPKIFSIQIIDKRKNKKTTIQRGQASILNGLQIFRSFISETDLNIDSDDSDHQKNKKLNILAYKTNPNLHSVIAVPVKIQNNIITLLKVDDHVPRLFKEFPLIGTEDWGYNYVLTCKFFHPNEKRTGIRLKLIQTRPDSKVLQNRALIQKLMEDVQALYTTLANKISQNLGYLAISNNDSKSKIQCETFFNTKIFDRFKKFISQLNFVRLVDKSLTSLSKIIFPFYQGTNFHNSKTISLEIYNVFYFLLKDKNIKKSEYEILFSALHFRPHTHWKFVQFGQINYYISKIEELSTTGLQRLQGTSNIIPLMDSIYKLLYQRFPIYTQQACERKIVINQKNNLCKLIDLRIEEQTPKIYQQFFIKLNIDIKDELINNDVKKYFKINNKFDIHYCQERFKKLFHIDTDFKLTSREFTILFNLITINNVNQYDKKAFYNNQFRSKIYQLGISLKELEKQSSSSLDAVQAINYKRFVLKFFAELLKRIDQNKGSSIKELSKIFVSECSGDKLIQWLNFYQSLVQNLDTSSTPYSKQYFYLKQLANSQSIFVNPSNLYSISFPFEQILIQIYNYSEKQRIDEMNTQFRKQNQVNYSNRSRYYSYQEIPYQVYKPLQTIIVHDKVSISRGILPILTFKKLFSETVSRYNKMKQKVILKPQELTQTERNFVQRILKYAQNILDQQISLEKVQNRDDNYQTKKIINKQKKDTFNQVYIRRAEVLLNLRKSSNLYQNLICAILSNPDDLGYLEKMILKQQSCQNVYKKLTQLEQEIDRMKKQKVSQKREKQERLKQKKIYEKSLLDASKIPDSDEEPQ